MVRMKGSNSDKKLAALMYRNNKHQSSIAAYFGVAQSTISAWIREGELLVQQEEMIQNQQKTLQETESYYLQQRLNDIERAHQTQIENLILMARQMAISQYDFCNRKNILDIEYDDEMKKLIENK